MSETAYKVNSLGIQNIEIHSGNYDPKVTGRTAPIGSLFIRESSDLIYRKYASGNTAWEQIYPKSTSRTVTTSGSILRDDNIIIADTTSGDITLTLPSPTVKQIFNVKKKVAANKLNINPFSTEKIDGNATLQIKNINSSVTLSSDGTDWYII